MGQAISDLINPEWGYQNNQLDTAIDQWHPLHQAKDEIALNDGRNCDDQYYLKLTSAIGFFCAALGHKNIKLQKS